jgi:NADH-quinone oxidoreductase subunit I
VADLKSFVKNWTLAELLKGMSITGRHFFAPKITVQYPEEKTPMSPRAMAITIESEQREDGSRRTTRYDIDLTKCIFCGFCEESCPVDSIVETRIFEYHGEQRGDLLMTKEKLLAVGDRYEAQIAADRAEDAPYR